MNVKLDKLHFILIGILLLMLISNVTKGGLHIADIGIITIAGRVITLFNIIVIGIVIWLLRYLGSPFREIILFCLLLWVLSLFAGFLFSGLTNVFILLLLILILFSFF